MRLEPSPRLVDASILAAVVAAVATGVGSAFAGRPSDAWVFVVHGTAGIVLAVFLGWKLRRVRRRLRPSQWDASVAVSVLTLLAALGTLATGVYWGFGGTLRLLHWNGLMVHVALGGVLVVALLGHLMRRWRRPRRADVAGRRTALQYVAVVGGGGVAWRLQQALTASLGVATRFTGSREQAGDGTDFPVTSWVADDPDPVDAAAWRLRIEGAVDAERSYGYDALVATDRRRATLDCTSGWYTTRDWSGVRVGRLLDAAGVDAHATWVSFRSVTGYRWSLPIGEARETLLATHVDDARLDHGHGFPVRLVAPGRRGFQWVKWVEAVEVRTDPDYGQWIAIFASGFYSNV
jgi:DMSO/TMAO reductase YedYZ molybdopterin-dependent catalytic subunit